MPTYGKKEFKESNVKYLNKDFSSLKNSLIQYAKSYFPNSYQDFNETSPGMMLIEMSAYVGDVMSFYVDQQYREMLLPLSEERRNIILMAKMFGYKVKPIYASHVSLTFSQIVNSVSGDESNVDYNSSSGGASVFDKGIKLQSSTNQDIFFETLEPIDFTITNPKDTEVVNSYDSSTGLISSYRLSRTVKAISSETKTKTFNAGSPRKFLELTLSDTNVIEIISIMDLNNNRWYEVDYLAQDKVPIETHYSQDDNRSNAYQDIEDQTDTLISVPYALEFTRTNKRFVTEVNEDNTTSLRFGNGIVKNGSSIDGDYLDLEQAGITIPGQTANLTDSIDNLLNDEYDTLGETPNQTNLTVTYRVGGGINSNVSSGDIQSIVSGENVIAGYSEGILTSVSNNIPAVGGKNQETLDEIREKTMSNFATQNRAVTRHDYKARILNMSSKFGSVAKVMVSRLSGVAMDDYTIAVSTLLDAINQGVDYSVLNEIVNDYDFTPPSGTIGTVNINILSYNNIKSLVGNAQASALGTTDYVPKLIHQNIKNYLTEYRILTDTVSIQDGYIINFGVIFDVIAHKNSNKAQIKLRCIEKIKEYFRIENMQFSQPIHVSQLEYELMDIDGVRAVNQLCITQGAEYDKTGNHIGGGKALSTDTYYYSWDESTGDVTFEGGNVGYGWKYDFRVAYENGVIRPPSPQNPGVFELKNPNTNIIGVVR